MNILFFGSGAFGLPTLRALTPAHRVVGIVTQPDRPAGRSLRPTATPIGEWARQSLPNTPLFTPENVNAPESVAALRALPADAFLVIAFGQKLGQDLLADRFAINLHASLLPRWRGAAPIAHAILAGDEWTGNSVITVAPRMDSGSVLGQARVSIDPLRTAGELHDQLAADGPALVSGVLEEAAGGRLRPVQQNPGGVTLAPKLSKADSWIDFAQPALACRSRIHGLNPWPGVEVLLRNKPLRLLRAKDESVGTEPIPVDAAAGSLLRAEDGLVACGGPSVIRLLEVQPAGGRPMTWGEFARGRRPITGERLSGTAKC